MNEVDLVCPRCSASNRPGVRYIELHENQKTAECSVCAYAGFVADFHPQSKEK